MISLGFFLVSHRCCRHILRKVDEQLESGKLLGTQEGLEAVAKFLAKTGAFTKTGTTRKDRTKPVEDDEENAEEEERWWARMETETGITGW